MQRIIWRVVYISAPKAVRYCKKCGVKTEFASSGMFRVNAQQKYLDVWLIYKCACCESTWNLTLYSRANPKSFPAGLLAGFHVNDGKLAARYAMDTALLRKSGAEITLPEYLVIGEEADPKREMELRLTAEYPSEVRVSALLRNGLGLSRKEFEVMLDNGGIRCVSGQDLRKCRLKGEIVIRINDDFDKNRLYSQRT